MRIVIDAGHGGNDSGAIGTNGIKEKDIVLKIALKLRDYMQKYELETVMTRSEDFFLSLNERVEIANKSGASYFISIHCNSYINQEANGTESYVYAKKGETYEFSKSIHNQLVQTTQLKDRGVKEASYAVLTGTVMPAVLIEVAFLSNPIEEQLLINPNFQDKVAGAIAKGLGDYLGIEMNSKPHWGQESINKLLERGIITSPKDPEAPVTWAEFATVILRILE